MRCKFCGAELMDDITLCTECGKDNAKNSLDSLQKRVKTMRVALLILLAVVLVAAVAVVVIMSVWGDREQEENPTTAPSTQTAAPSTQATVPTDGNPEDQTCKGSYTAADDLVIAGHDAVVATMGDAKLTNGQFVIYYWNAVYDFLVEYGSYSAYFGLDMGKPLDTQTCTMLETPMTWQQAFVLQGINAWKTCQAIVNDAKKADFKLPADYEEPLKNLRSTMELSALENKFESVEAMLEADYGAGCTFEDYYSYMESYYYSNAYYEYLMNELDITDEQIEKFLKDNAEALKSQYGIEEAVAPLISVRHILIRPEGGTAGTSGTTYSDAEWEACRAKAQKIYDEWQAGAKTEETFIEAVKANSGDGNAQQGGLYEDVYTNMMVKEFNDWCFDKSRQAGDHGLVKTQYGYHIMYFVDSYSGTHPVILSGITNEQMQDYLEGLIANCGEKVDYKQMLVPEIKMPEE